LKAKVKGGVEGMESKLNLSINELLPDRYRAPVVELSHVCVGSNRRRWESIVHVHAVKLDEQEISTTTYNFKTAI
jgi:hypothetical protein